MAKRGGGNVGWVNVLAVLLHSKNAESLGRAHVVNDYAGQVVWILPDHLVRVADAVACHGLHLQARRRATQDKPRVAVAWPHFGEQLDELAERVPPGHVARFTPCMEVIGDDGVVSAVAGRGGVFVWREKRRELGHCGLGGREVFDEIQRFEHHYDAVARGLVAFAGSVVGLGRVKAICARALIREKLALQTGGQPLVAVARSDGGDCALIPWEGGKDFLGVDGEAHSPVKLTSVRLVVSPLSSS